jgi:hypothetical protein
MSGGHIENDSQVQGKFPRKAFPFAKPQPSSAVLTRIRIRFVTRLPGINGPNGCEPSLRLYGRHAQMG